MKLSKLFSAMQISRKLRMKICEVIIQISRWVVCCCQKDTYLVKARLTGLNEMPRCYNDTFFHQTSSMRRHRARGEAADFSVMRSIGHITEKFTMMKYGCDQGHVW